MKRILSAIIFITILCSFAAAETDLKTLSYNELLELHHQLDAEIMSRSEWKEVDIPTGEWVIGEDIPAGNYSVSTTHELGGIITVYQDSEKDDLESDMFVIQKTAPIGKLVLKDGMVLEILVPVSFSPAIGLGF